MIHWRHRLFQALVALVLLAAVLGLAALVIVQSGWFRERVRTRIADEIQKATGATVEVANFTFDWRTLTANVAPLILHGKETAMDAPLAKIGSVKVGLKILSIFERQISLSSLRVTQPEIHIIIYPDGSTNLPSPAPSGPAQPWPQQLLNLKVDRYAIVDGVIDFDSRQIPLNVRGENLDLNMSYEASGTAAKTPRYAGRLTSTQIQIAARELPATAVAVSTSFAIESAQVIFPQMDVTLGNSRARLSGALKNLQAPAGRFTVKASASPSDILPFLKLPEGGPRISGAGQGAFNGLLTISFSKKFEFRLEGGIDAENMELQQDRMKLQGITAKATLEADTTGVWLRDIVAAVNGSRVTGSAEFTRGKAHAEGVYQNVDVRDTVALWEGTPIVWSGTASGSFILDSTSGEQDTVVRATALIAPLSAPGTVPIEGQLDLRWEQRNGTVAFGESRLATPSTTLRLSGTLGRTLEVRAISRNLDDLLPALSLAGRPATSLPLKLDGGEASVAGSVAGSLDHPQFRGQIQVTKASFEKHGFDQFTASLAANKETIVAKALILTRGAARITGDAELMAAPNGDYSQGNVNAQLKASGLHAQELAKEFNQAIPGDGNIAATLHLTGSVTAPEIDAQLDVTGVTAYREQADRIRAHVRHTSAATTVTGGEASIGMGRATFNGVYTSNGELTGSVAVQNLEVARFQNLKDRLPNLGARVDGQSKFAGRLVNDQWTVHSLSGEIAAHNVTYDGESLGDLNATAETTASDLTLRATGRLKDSTLEGQGKWALAGDLPGSASFSFSRMTVDQLHDLVMLGNHSKPSPPPFEGSFNGSGTATVSLRKPQDFQAELTIAALQLNAKPSQTLRLDVQPQDLQIRNSAPVVFALSSKEMRIRSAHFVARDTNLEATGTVPFTGTGGADLAINGTVNLGILQLFNPDLLARGTATVNTSVRGSLQDPQLNGRMELSGASLYLADVPNGIDAASGVILFDRSRATIDRLSAETGGGQVAIRGYVDFSQALVYRLQADVRQVRVRYPQDVSMTANAQLTLNGTPDASTLSGSLTLNRAAISPGADLGQLLASGATPNTASADPDDYLRGVRLDLRVESAPTFEVETSLTRNVQTEVDLRIRGMLRNPNLQGTVSVDSGEVQVFGSRYTVNRGDIRFLNPLKIEPVLDLNLETRTRGITVNVAVAGTPQKLNVNYSSDPPLQSREIIALLASGRDPNSTASTSQVSSSAASLGSAGGIIGEAVSQQLSSRLQRFFGASRVKIDPTQTNIDTQPTARLTLEQQVSRDITLTYTTNLTRTQEQIVRVQWDVNPQWSAIAVRDANGLFGIDFQYRKRFK